MKKMKKIVLEYVRLDIISSYLLLLGKEKLQSFDISNSCSKFFIVQKIYINVIQTKTSR